MKTKYIISYIIGVILIGMLVFAPTSVVNMHHNAENIHLLEKTKNQNMNQRITPVAYRSEVMESMKNLIIKDSVINGSVYLSNKTNALFDDVTISSGTMIVLNGDAKLVIRNSYWEGEISIVLRDYSRLTIENMLGSGSSMDISMLGDSHLYLKANLSNSYIFMSGGASAHIENCSIQESTIELENASSMEISYIRLKNVNFYLRHSALLYGRVINDTNEASDIRLEDYSRLNGSQFSLNSTRITLNDYAFIGLFDTNVSEVYAYDYSYVLLEVSEAYALYIYDEALGFVIDSTVTQAFLDIIGKFYEPKINILRSTLTYLMLKSFAVNNITNSHVGTLEYLTIHTGNLYVDSSSTTSDSSYVNYHLQDSTVDSMVESSITAAKGSPYVEYNVSGGYLILVNVPSAEILDVENLYAYNTYGVVHNSSTDNMWVYLYGSEVVLDTFELGSIQITPNNSNVTILNMTIAGIYISSYLSEIHVVNDSTIRAPFIEMYSSNISVIHSKLLSVAQLLLNRSKLLLNHSLITNGSTMAYQMYHSKVIFQDSNVSLALFGDAYLESRDYVMRDGAVTNADIRFGIVDMGDNDLTNFEFYGDIHIINASLNYTGKYMGLDYHINFTLMNNSKLGVKDLYAKYIHVYVADLGSLNITNTSIIANIVATQLNILMDKSNVTYFETLEVHGSINSTVINNAEVLSGVLLLADSNITEQFTFREGTLSIIGGNISSIQLGALDESDITILYTTLVTVEDANIAYLSSLSRGELNVSGSTIDRLMSVVSKVNIFASTIDTVSRSYKITASGTVEIDSNSIPDGTYEELLTVVGSSINHYADIVVADMNMDLSLVIRDSNYFGVFASCYSVQIENTNLSNMFIQANETYVSNVNVNSSFMDEPPPVFLGGARHNNLRMDGLHIDGTSLVLSNANVSARDIVASALMIMNSGGQMNNTYLLSEYPYIKMLSSGITFYELSVSNYGFIDALMSSIVAHSTNITSARVVNSSLSIFDDKILESVMVWGSNLTLSSVNMVLPEDYYSLEGIIVGNNSAIIIDNSNITRITPVVSYGPFYGDMLSADPSPLPIIIAPFVTKINAQESKFSSTYVEYFAKNLHDDLVFESPYPERTYLTTTYVSSSINSVDSAIINVVGISHLNITGFGDTEIVFIYAMFGRSATTPTIELYNGTNIAYEFGLEAKLVFAIFDDDPYTYNLTIDGIYTDIEEYESGELISYVLSDIIDEPGNYPYSITATDISGNEYSIGGNITVYPAEPPEITSTPPEETTIDVGENVLLRWTAQDASPARYKISINGSVVEENSWGGEAIEYNFTASEPGTYNITITFIDKLNIKANNSVIIHVRTTETRGEFPTTTIYMIVGIIAVSAIAIAVLILLRKRGLSS